jgi:hypothetical protein
MHLRTTISVWCRRENRCLNEESFEWGSGGVWSGRDGGRSGSCRDGFSGRTEQVREKRFWHVANDRIDEPCERKRNGATEFDRLHLDVRSAKFFFDVPPGAESPHITVCIGGRKFALVGLAVILHFRHARGARTNLRLRRRIVPDLRGKMHVEHGGDRSLIVKLQENFAGVPILRHKFGLPHVGKIVVPLVIVIHKNGFGLRERCILKKGDAHPVVNDAAGY